MLKGLDQSRYLDIEDQQQEIVEENIEVVVALGCVC